MCAYKLCVQEIRTKVVEIDAGSEDEAIDKLAWRYANGLLDFSPLDSDVALEYLPDNGCDRMIDYMKWFNVDEGSIDG